MPNRLTPRDPQKLRAMLDEIDEILAQPDLLDEVMERLREARRDVEAELAKLTEH